MSDLYIAVHKHPYIVQRESDCSFVSRFSNLQAAAEHVVQQKDLCCVITSGGSYDHFDCKRLVSIWKLGLC